MTRLSIKEARALGIIPEPEPKSKAKKREYANKGKTFEAEIELTNNAYESQGIALIQKISTPWKVIRKGARIISAFPEGKSTLDFRGTVKEGGISISFDCKESENERGLPLAHIQEHQIEYIRKALGMNEISFILCYVKKLDKRYLIKGSTVLEYWECWQKNKGKRGFNYIPVQDMVEIKSRDGILVDYLSVLEGAN